MRNLKAGSDNLESILNSAGGSPDDNLALYLNNVTV